MLAARPAAARVRPRAARRLHRGPPGPGRASGSRRWTTSSARSTRGPADHRRRAGAAGHRRRHGRRHQRGHRRHDRRPGRVRALRPDHGGPVLAPAQAARPRPAGASSAASTPTSPRPPRELAVDLLAELGGGVPDAGVTDVDQREPREPVRLDADPAGPAGRPALHPAGRRRHAARDRLRRRRPPARATTCWCCRPAGAPTCSDGADLVEEVARLRGYDQIPSVLPQAPGRAAG